MIPMATMEMNAPSNFGCNALLNMITDGKDKAVIAIIRARIVPAGSRAECRKS